MEEKKQQQGLNLKVVKDFEIFLSIPRKKTKSAFSSSLII